MTIRVVVADDQAVVRAGIAMLVTVEDDLQVVGEAADGRQAVDLARDLVPDVVIMDVRMPFVDGVAATREIVALRPAESVDAVKVLALTMFDADDAVFDMIRAGASGFILKDAAASDLPMAVRMVASGNAWLDPSVAGRGISEVAARPAVTCLTAPRFDRLTERERHILALMAQGLSNAEIAEHCFVTEGTVKTHVSRLLLKLEVRDRTQAVILAYQAGRVPSLAVAT
jgi:DNA-binding NarL/FixJ family response regulator